MNRCLINIQDTLKKIGSHISKNNFINDNIFTLYIFLSERGELWQMEAVGKEGNGQTKTEQAAFD